jgi:hypothetical protein
VLFHESNSVRDSRKDQQDILILKFQRYLALTPDGGRQIFDIFSKNLTEFSKLEYADF